MEKAGKPAVGIVSAGFERDTMHTARAFGMPEFRFALVPHIVSGLSPHEIEQEITDALQHRPLVAVVTLFGSLFLLALVNRYLDERERRFYQEHPDDELY